ncbi:MAG: acyl-CoA dehydrogenase family protein [Pseudomonadota bacterium]
MAASPGSNLDHAALVESIEHLLRKFGDDYWIACDTSGTFPSAYYDAIADAGWLGIAMPEAFGGAGLGVTEASMLMHAVAKAGGMTAASAIHINIFGPHPIVVHGTERQKSEWLPPLISGAQKCCFGVTEPDAGLDTTQITTRAERTGGGYRVTGQKIWTSTAQHADKIMLLARTTPRENCDRKTDGLSLFYTDLDRSRIEVREIAKMGRKAVDSNQVFLDDVFVPDDDLIGDEGKGFRYILDSLNPERVLIAVEAIGIGQDAVRRAAAYARDRVVFDRPIGTNQSIQHPIAESWMELEAAHLMALEAARLYDRGLPCAAQANAAKYLGAEAALKACTNAVRTHGGMGYAREYHVERLLREVMIPVLAPVSGQMILNFVAEKVLDLPRSY